MEICFLSLLHFHQEVCSKCLNSILLSAKLPKCFLPPCDGPFLCVYKTLNIYLLKFLLVNQSSSFPPRLLCVWFLHSFSRLCVLHSCVSDVFFIWVFPVHFSSSISFYLLPIFLIFLVHLCFNSLTSTVWFVFSSHLM